MRMTPPVSAQMPAAQYAARLFSSEPTRKRSPSAISIIPSRTLERERWRSSSSPVLKPPMMWASPVSRITSRAGSPDRLSNHLVKALVEEHDESGDDAGAAGHERDASRALAGESRTDADDPGKRPKRTHVGCKVVARLSG